VQISGPRGRKSRPTSASSTLLLPLLWLPTTATCGRSSLKSSVTCARARPRRLLFDFIRARYHTAVPKVQRDLRSPPRCLLLGKYAIVMAKVQRDLRAPAAPPSAAGRLRYSDGWCPKSSVTRAAASPPSAIVRTR